MTEPKTKATNASVEDFLASIENERRQQDGFTLLNMYKRVTGLEPKMWGPAIIGFGVYQVKSGDWPLAAFSPRKQNLTLYVEPQNFPDLLKDLGKHSTSVACLYINKLDDVDLKALEKLIAASYQAAKEKYA